MTIRCSGCFSEYDEEFGLCPFCGRIEGETGGEVFCLAPGTLIADRYIIGEMLGLGGFGITYKAWDKKLNTTMAIKEYYPSGMVNRLPGEVNVFLVAAKQERAFVYGKTRFLQEARNLAKFSTHKNIVNVFEYFEANNTAYIVMEFLDGRTIREVMQQQNVPLPYDYCISIASDICSALKALHKENILHRDVSPDNIMLCTNGTVKLLDFGAARFSAGIESRVSVVVKPGFAPPEQYDKVNKQDGRTDLYALGATLYYAMTGVKPEESTNRKVQDTVREPSAIDNNIPETISTAIMRAMAVEQQYRFADVDAFEEALQSEKKIASVQDQRRKKKIIKISGILAAGLAVFTLLVVSLHVLSGDGGGVPSSLPKADLDLWYITTGNQDFDRAKKEALDGILTAFSAKYSNVALDVTPVPQEQYAQMLSQAINNGTAPDVFESTGLPKIQLEHAGVLDKQNKNLKGKSYGNNVLSTSQQVPTGIVVPVIYVNTALGTIDSVEDLDQLINVCRQLGEYFVVKESAVDLYAALYGTEIVDYSDNRAKNDFLERKAFIYFGDSTDYFEIQNAVPGEYMLLMPGSVSAVYRYSGLWSWLPSDKNTDTAANGLISYFSSKLAQDYFHIQAHSGCLPIVKESLHEFALVYDELDMVTEYLERKFVAPMEDLSGLLVVADTTRLMTLKSGASAVFADVPADMWYTKAVSKAYAKGLMDGVNVNQFEPDRAISKIDIITALYRASGKPDVKEEAPFSDVDSYTEQGKAAAWAYVNGIASGTGEGEFRGNDPVNLETCMLLLYHYAGKAGYDMSIEKKNGQFADGAAVGDWANDSVMWAISKGLFNVQNGGTISPQTVMTRGRFAVILENMLALDHA